MKNTDSKFGELIGGTMYHDRGFAGRPWPNNLEGPKHVESFRCGVGLGLSAAAAIADKHGAHKAAAEIREYEKSHVNLDEYFGVKQP